MLNLFELCQNIMLVFYDVKGNLGQVI